MGQEATLRIWGDVSLLGHEIRGDMGRYGEILGDVSLLGHEIREDMGRYGEILGDTGRYGDVSRF